MVNVLMALSIAAIIVVIASLTSARAKAIVYSLPIPITMALIASRNGVDGSHVIGLGLLMGFLWLVSQLSSRGINILLADVISATAYVGVGYAILGLKDMAPFYILCITYAVFWLIFRLFERQRPAPIAANVSGKKINLWLKALVVFFIAYCLLETKNLLSGIVVTFPFLGVFAVVEMKENLRTLSREFAKNSIAILAFFVMVHFLWEQ